MTSNRRPKLLVSVRNLEEAQVVLDVGCDILDFKEPNNGPLGRVDRSVLVRALGWVFDQKIDSTRGQEPLHVSIALGDDSWTRMERGHDRFETMQEFRLETLIAGFPELKSKCYFKFESGWIVPGWALSNPKFSQGYEHVVNERRQFQQRLLGLGQPLSSIVAVAFADQTGGVTDIKRAMKVAQEQGCEYFLLDTSSKQDRYCLTNTLCLDELEVIATSCHDLGLKLALAGGIIEEDLTHLKDIACDVIGIRGAACENGERGATISRDRLIRFKKKLHEVFG